MSVRVSARAPMPSLKKRSMEDHADAFHVIRRRRPNPAPASEVALCSPSSLTSLLPCSIPSVSRVPPSPTRWSTSNSPRVIGGAKLLAHRPFVPLPMQSEQVLSTK
jgi:hypothetical protein